MPAPSRRILLYWLLLLLPTLAVGAGALYLLRKEQARLDQQARSVTSLRRETIAARARQIAENLELLVGDVQAGLMGTLNQATASSPDVFLNSWAGSNPLVQTTFRLTASDQIIRPTAGPDRQWLQAWIAAGVPWRTRGRQAEESQQALEQRKDMVSNLSQTQSVRNSFQETARQGVLSDASKAKAEASAPTSKGVERSDWVSWRGADGLHMIGWRQLAFGGVIGVEVNLASIAARLGELLPQDGDMADAFEVRGSGIVRQRREYAERGSLMGRVGRTAETVEVPLAANLLPGWVVVGYVGDGPGSVGAGGAFFFVGALLVGTFVVAILAGGTLLLRDARRSEAEAAQKTSFVANVSHEFKTPLTTIRLYAELLEQGRVRDEAQGGDYLRTIARETQRLARLVNNALDFSRLEQGQKKFTRETLDLTAEISRLLDAHEPRLADAGLTMKRELPATAMVVTSDRDALEQIVLNLLDNACKYAAEGGEVTVQAMAGAGGRGAEIHVLDCGPGVPTEHRERIFEKFHRVDDTLTAEKSGAGLGLSIARQLARGLGGELRYTPRAGGGAEFILSLP